VVYNITQACSTLGIAHRKARRLCQMARCHISNEVLLRCLLGYHVHLHEPRNIQCNTRSSTHNTLRNTFAAQALTSLRLDTHNILKDLLHSRHTPMRRTSLSTILKRQHRRRCSVLRHKQAIHRHIQINILSTLNILVLLRP
jgi:hypothetical protein